MINIKTIIVSEIVFTANVASGYTIVSSLFYIRFELNMSRKSVLYPGIITTLVNGVHNRLDEANYIWFKEMITTVFALIKHFQ